MSRYLLGGSNVDPMETEGEIRRFQDAYDLAAGVFGDIDAASKTHESALRVLEKKQKDEEKRGQKTWPSEHL